MNEQARAMHEAEDAETREYMRIEYQERKKELIAELKEINAQLEKL